MTKGHAVDVFAVVHVDTITFATPAALAKSSPVTSREPRNTPNTRKHDITVGGFISVCSVCSVVKKTE